MRSRGAKVARGAHRVFDLVGIGEVLIQLSPSPGVCLAAAEQLDVHVGGAEANVAVGLAQLGHQTAVVSRVGADPFGDKIVQSLRRVGVDVHAIERDPDLATGIYFKDPHGTSTTSHYYRQHSAATRLSPQHGEGLARQAHLLHLTGISPALSPSCFDLVQSLLGSRPSPGSLRAFDVNYRPGLWPDGEASDVLLELARQADIVFIGRDEAARLWDVTTAEDVKTLLADVPLLVLKDGAAPSTAFDAGGPVSVPALDVEVVEPIGAGDAFASGFLAGCLRGTGAEVAQRWGHLMAAATLQSHEDQPSAPPRDLLDRVARMSPSAWAAGEVLGHPYFARASRG